MVYGEGATDPEDSNLRGQAHSMYDGAGLIKTPTYDFRGRPTGNVRRFAALFDGPPDWSSLSSSIDPDTVESSASSMLEGEE